MIAVGLSADCLYHPALTYQPGWAALPLGLVELGALMATVLLLGVRAPVVAALALFGGAWVWTQLLGQALLPSWRWGYAEEDRITRYVADAQVLPIFEGVKATLELKVIARGLVSEEPRA